MNMVEGQLTTSNGTYLVDIGGQHLALDPALIEQRPALQGFAGRPVIVGIRPEEMEDAALQPDAPADRRMKTVVDLREDMGSEVFVYFNVDAPPVLTEDTKELAADLGASEDDLLEQASDRARFVARFDADSTAQENDRIEVLVNTKQLHFFDPETRLAIWDQG
jgi:multiple sugar transport system ATP-binding protein